MDNVRFPDAASISKSAAPKLLVIVDYPALKDDGVIQVNLSYGVRFSVYKQTIYCLPFRLFQFSLLCHAFWDRRYACIAYCRDELTITLDAFEDLVI
ncbi:hypothetical protein E2562_005001 [Oryza meyeriana var. granulata]|uniref:Uncharacterized protein n=1 Tax=Oryza meyeriana var. granulata TaxID=110450 RepID=A0A6G1C5C9_9ORYZ|nr:hypothetical protein E2562_005001 [Oryza meyeriana var. granulata]